MQKYEVDGHIPSYLPEGRAWKLVWSDEFHTFAVDWEPDGYTFYFDGVKRGEKYTAHVSETEQFILLHTEPLGYRGEANPPKELFDAILPDCLTVDYVRVFDAQ